MSPVTKTKAELISPVQRTLYTKYAKTKKYPKSFGSFFANSWFEKTKSLSLNYRDVCVQNKWNHSHFNSFTPMLRWLIKNNASEKSIYGVLDLALWHHINSYKQYNSPEECQFLYAYSCNRYADRNNGFDYTKFPKQGFSSNTEDDF